MITCVTKFGTCNGVTVELCELRGKSTDVKPTDVANGSEFIEMDTGACFLFDEEEKTWWPL